METIESQQEKNAFAAARGMSFNARKARLQMLWKKPSL